MGFLNFKVLIGRYALISQIPYVEVNQSNSMLEIKASVELIDHLRNHLSDLVQTHESYQIQWESRLSKTVGLCRKEI